MKSSIFEFSTKEEDVALGMEERLLSVGYHAEFGALDPKEQFKKIRKSSFLMQTGGWSSISGYSTPERRRTVALTKVSLMKTFDRDRCINFTDNYSVQGDVQVKKRIGTESVYGQVYLGEVEFDLPEGIETAGILKNSVAIKVMPITTPQMYENNLHELDVMYKLTQLVLTGKSDHFPVLYLDTTCEHTMLPLDELPGGMLVRKGAHFGLIETLSETFGYDKDEVESLRTEMDRASKPEAWKSFIDTCAIYGRLIEMNPIAATDKRANISPMHNIRANIAVIELAESDVANVLKTKTYTYLQIYDMVLQVSMGIKDMQKYYNYVHNDLHAGNVLIVKDVSESGFIRTRYLINDFGLTRDVDQTPRTEKKWNKRYLLDIERFVGVLVHHTSEEVTTREERASYEAANIASTILSSLISQGVGMRTDAMDIFLAKYKEGMKRNFGRIIEHFRMYNPVKAPTEKKPKMTVRIKRGEKRKQAIGGFRLKGKRVAVESKKPARTNIDDLLMNMIHVLKGKGAPSETKRIESSFDEVVRKERTITPDNLAASIRALAL